jgi:hypothetical protein
MLCFQSFPQHTISAMPFPATNFSSTPHQGRFGHGIAMSGEQKENSKLRSQSLSGDAAAAGDGSKKFYFLNTATPSPAASKHQERRYQTMEHGEEKLEEGNVTPGQ